MNFFEAQDRTRRNTRWLIVMFALATLLITAAVTMVAEVAFLTAGMNSASGIRASQLFDDPVRTAISAAIVLGVILLASLYRVMQLRTGGARVAQEMGATLVSTDVQDPLRQRLRNVVEEMAIASGVPVPQIFVLEEESAINAFAAGFSPSDAAIAVTRGTLEQLDRDELQGVVAHEFSHILNGDMRLNVRLMGVLFGIIVIGQAGRLLLRSMSSGSRSIMRGNSRNSGSVMLVIGIALFVLGAIGVFVARLIRAGVSRQREYLADASAVQFTRQTEGIAGALTKIGGYADGSALTTVDSEEVSHMLIANGARRSLISAFASHPPIESRIRALDASLLNMMRPDARRSAPKPTSENALFSSLTDTSASVNIGADDSVSRVGNPGSTEIAMASAIRRSIPALIYDAAHSREWALYLALTLALDPQADVRERQLTMLAHRLGDTRCQRIRRYAQTMEEMGSRYRLPVLELCFPALKQRPAGQLQFLIKLIDDAHAILSHPGLREFAFRATLAHSLEASLNPGRNLRARATHFGKVKTRHAAHQLLQALAQHGHVSAEVAGAAYAAGAEVLGSTALELRTETVALSAVSAALDQLAGLIGRDLKKLLTALVVTIHYDGDISIEESELMRLISVALNCPLPPIIDATFERALPTDTQ